MNIFNKLLQVESLEKYMKGVYLAGALVLALITLQKVILQGYSVEWTGFGDFRSSDGDFVRGKTLWDWLQLLVIPIFLSLGLYLMNRSERNNERDMALDRQREGALQSYLDRITELLINKDLRTTANEEVRNVARIRTLSVLPNLDAKRKGLVIKFLHEAGLIDRLSPVIRLEDADLAGAYLARVNLSNGNLSGANLSDANLIFADLSNANLDSTSLHRTKLWSTNLSGATLNGAGLWLARFENTNLTKADLSNVNFFRTIRHVNRISPRWADNVYGAVNLTTSNLDGVILTGSNPKCIHYLGRQIKEHPPFKDIKQK